jgi:hypothetical protein
MHFLLRNSVWFGLVWFGFDFRFTPTDTEAVDGYGAQNMVTVQIQVSI